MAHARCTLDTYCYTHTHTHTHSQCVIVIAFSIATMVARTRLNVFFQTYIACLCYEWMFLEALPVYNWRTITRIICWRLFILCRPNKALCLEAVSTNCSQSTHIAMVTWNEIFLLGVCWRNIIRTLIVLVNFYAFVGRCCNYWTGSAMFAPFGTCRKENMRNNLKLYLPSTQHF